MDSAMDLSAPISFCTFVSIATSRSSKPGQRANEPTRGQKVGGRVSKRVSVRVSVWVRVSVRVSVSVRVRVSVRERVSKRVWVKGCVRVGG